MTNDRKPTSTQIEAFPTWLRALGVALVIGFGGFVFLLWQLGLFKVPPGGPDARIFAAVFALLGALFGAVITFSVALLKHAIDVRTWN